MSVISVMRNGRMVDIVVPDLSPEEIAAQVAGKAARDLKAEVPISGMVFLARVTDAEYVAIVQAAATQLAAGNGTLSRWIDMLRVNGRIFINDANAQAAKAALVTAGLLTQERADIIFAAE